MARQGINYNDFKTAWLRLEAQGRATIAAVNAEIGGSNQTLMKLRNRLREEQQADTLQGLELPLKVKQSIYGFAEQYNQLLTKQLSDQVNDISEYQKELEQLTKHHQEKEAQWALREKTLEASISKLEKSLAAREAQLADAKEREQGLNDDNKILLEQRHSAEKAEAVAKTEAKGYLKRIELLEGELKAKRSK